MKVPKWGIALAVFFAVFAMTMVANTAYADGEALPEGQTISGILAVAEEDNWTTKTAVVFGGVTGPWTACDRCVPQRTAWINYRTLQDACNAAHQQAAARKADPVFAGFTFTVITHCDAKAASPAPAPQQRWWRALSLNECVTGYWAVVQTDWWVNTNVDYFKIELVDGTRQQVCDNDRGHPQVSAWIYSDYQFALDNVCVAFNNSRNGRGGLLAWTWAIQNGRYNLPHRC